MQPSCSQSIVSEQQTSKKTIQASDMGPAQQSINLATCPCVVMVSPNNNRPSSSLAEENNQGMFLADANLSDVSSPQPQAMYVINQTALAEAPL
mmetsp:Transcript_469/g.979  ORF Transcript_469/g.979 Transcript_469/m.979 type:complete len:94 (+) Transcript_469:34-315(+)